MEFGLNCLLLGTHVLIVMGALQIYIDDDDEEEGGRGEEGEKGEEKLREGKGRDWPYF